MSVTFKHKQVLVKERLLRGKGRILDLNGVQLLIFPKVGDHKIN